MDAGGAHCGVISQIGVSRDLKAQIGEQKN